MKTPVGGNKWSHEQTRRIQARRNAQRRNPDKCKCGRFLGSPLCQCRIEQCRRDMLAQDNIQLLMKMD